MKESASERYFASVIGMLDQISRSQAAAIEQAAQAVFRSLSGGGMLYLFGTGHAHLLAEELFYRAGGLARVCAILDERLMLHVSASESTQWERRAGIAKELLDSCPTRAGDVMLIASNSGRNSAPVEMAVEARARGMFTIAVTNLRHSRQAAAANQHGLKLYEAADLVIDTLGMVGDACVDIGPGLTMGATSTVAGAAIVQAIACRAGELAVLSGNPLETFTSSNVPGGDLANEALIARYRGVIRGL